MSVIRYSGGPAFATDTASRRHHLRRLSPGMRISEQISAIVVDNLTLRREPSPTAPANPWNGQSFDNPLESLFLDIGSYVSQVVAQKKQTYMTTQRKPQRDCVVA